MSIGVRIGIVIVLLLVLLLAFAFDAFTQLADPVIKSQMAMKQMTNDPDSATAMHTYELGKRWIEIGTVAFFVLIGILLMSPEIKQWYLEYSA